MRYCGKCGTPNPDDNLYCEKCGHKFTVAVGQPLESVEPKPQVEFNSSAKEVAGYRLQREIGRGGMGIVYLAENLLIKKQAAIKVLSPNITTDKQFRTRFFAEAESLAKLDHQNIARLENFVEQGGNYYLVLEYVPGMGLDEIIDTDGKIEQQEALKIFQQILEALKFSHGAGIFHRDIKPSNIRITPDGRVKILDFGIALIVGGKRLTQTGTTIGTPEYMSPEQIVRPKEMDHRSDLYSAGIVLYEMLTGRVPFFGNDDSGSSDYGIKDQQVKTEPQDPRRLNPEIPVTLSQIILKALEKDPDDRYSGSEHFIKTLKAFNKEEPIKSLNNLNKKPNIINKTPDIELVEIPENEFLMGRDGGFFCDGDRKPAHRIVLDRYLISKTQVTQALYKSIMKENLSCSKEDNCPVNMLSWIDAVNFCNLLSEHFGIEPCYDLKSYKCNFSSNGFRLPTEAEWECACRAGSEKKYCYGDDKDRLERVCWYSKNSDYKIQPVGEKEPNDWGLHDMHGNVWEWCNDWYFHGYYKISPTSNPFGPEKSGLKIVRGGSFGENSPECTSYYRNWRYPHDKFGDLGFRVVRK